jgi:hypothetical protein
MLKKQANSSITTDREATWCKENLSSVVTCMLWSTTPTDHFWPSLFRTKALKTPENQFHPTTVVAQCRWPLRTRKPLWQPYTHPGHRSGAFTSAIAVFKEKDCLFLSCVLLVGRTWGKKVSCPEKSPDLLTRSDLSASFDSFWLSYRGSRAPILHNFSWPWVHGHFR